jgi:hypothetical protein
MTKAETIDRPPSLSVRYDNGIYQLSLLLIALLLSLMALIIVTDGMQTGHELPWNSKNLT